MKELNNQDKSLESFDFKSFEEAAISGLQSGRPLFGDGGILKTLVKHLVEASLEGELDYHLWEQRASEIANKRNGKGRKKVTSTSGELNIEPPRDRNGDFEPQLIKKRERQLSSGLDGPHIGFICPG